MSNARNLAKVAVDANGDIGAASLDNLTGALGYTPVDKAGDTMTGDLIVNTNVGIGTSSPTDKLTVSNGGIVVNGGNVKVTDGSTTFQMGVNNFATGYGMGTTSNTPFIFAANGSERLRIDSAGRVTMPYQPAFFARTASNIANTGASSSFQYPVVEFNIGGHYNSSNWTFTAPVTGAYLFSAHCILNNYPVNNSVEVVFSRNNGTSYYFDRNSKTLNVSNRYSLGGSAVIYLGAGDSIKVFVYADTASSWSYESSSNFSGYLIG